MAISKYYLNRIVCQSYWKNNKDIKKMHKLKLKVSRKYLINKKGESYVKTSNIEFYVTDGYMFKIGCHLSASKGFKRMGEDALKIEANVFQFFIRNPRGSKAKEINQNDINSFLKLSKENKFDKILAHASYTLNLCSSDEKIRNFAIEVMEDDLKRMEYTPNNLYNFHPGNHLNQGIEIGINYISEALNKIIKSEQTTKVLLETMSGKGTEVGKTFEELALILSKVKLNNHIGICLDTCHVYDAGYDIVNNLDEVLKEFDNIIGLDKLCAIHLNDSKNSFASHKDRHEEIGKGNIGIEAIKNIINHPKLCYLPFSRIIQDILKSHALHG